MVWASERRRILVGLQRLSYGGSNPGPEGRIQSNDLLREISCSEIRNPLARAVLTAMVESGDYYFFALGATESATVFRSEIEQRSLMTLKKNLARIQGSTTTEAQYYKAMAFFAKTPEPRNG
jgi:hypothetical protein